MSAPASRPVRDWVRRHPGRFTALVVAAAFLAASVLPVWTAWYFGPLEFTGRPATFWTAAAAWVDIVRGPDGARRLSQTFLWGADAIKLVGVVAVAAFVGRRLAGFAPPDQAADYDDAPRPGPPGG